MLLQRIKLMLLFLPVVLVVVWLGGWVFAAGTALVLALAGVEFGRMYHESPHRPAVWLIGAGAAIFPIVRHAFEFQFTALLLALALAVGLSWHLVDFERGAPRSATDFAITAVGIIYIGWLGAYLVSLRNLPGGLWWLLLALPTVWLADIGAYLLGSVIGKRKLSPRISPNKSVEGYLSGIALATIGGAALAWVGGQLGELGPSMTPLHGLILGFIISSLAPLGDLGVSMFKRQLGVKDTGKLLGPHGGALDRMDTWFWTSLIGYYFVIFINGQ